MTFHRISNAFKKVPRAFQGISGPLKDVTECFRRAVLGALQDIHGYYKGFQWVSEEF